jgi:tRNA (guanine37-N1)-methyltransferase
MKISIITVFPELYESFLQTSLIARAIEQNRIMVQLIRFSDMVAQGQRIDEPTCGPGTGMILKPEVVQHAIEVAESKWGKGFKIFFSPQGKTLTQPLLRALRYDFSCGKITQGERLGVSPDGKCNEEHLILICARYEGIDQRVEDYYADLVLSIGDYVLMGGDLPAQVFLESFLRLIPGVVGKQESVEAESFSDSFLDYPEYGLPTEWNGKKVPEIVQSGDHKKIADWRREKAAEKTIYNRFDWFIKSNPSKEAITVAKHFIPNHYVALMHTNVFVKKDVVGNTSITSLDIHDIARSSATYDITNYFIVSQLEDQQNILQTFLTFWRSEEGKEYNQSRFDAVNRVVPAMNLNDVIKQIKEKEGKDPIIISTSARFKDAEKKKIIDFYSQGRIFSLGRPVLFVFGTAKGLSDDVIERSDFLLQPIVGMSDYNHLSVRSAVAIILDRWLGINYKSEQLK